MYDESIDHMLPWKEFKESFNQLEKKQSEYSTEIGQRIADIKEYLMDAIEQHTHASQNFNEWTSYAASILKSIIKVFDTHNAKKFDTPKQLLIDVFDKGAVKMNATQTEFHKVLLNYASVVEKLLFLRYEFIEKRNYFHKKIKTLLYRFSSLDRGAVINKLNRIAEILKVFDDLCNQLDGIVRNVANISATLLKSNFDFSDLKENIQQMSWSLNFDEKKLNRREMIIQAIQQLIAKCEDFLKRRANKIVPL